MQVPAEQPWPLLCRLYESTGRNDHCVMIMLGQIFDANEDQALDLTGQNLDRVCISGSFVAVSDMYQLKPGGRSLRKKLVKLIRSA